MGVPFQTATIVAMTVLSYMQVESYPMKPLECGNTSDCSPGECCVLGMMRYTVPQCMPMGQVEDYCRDENTPENRTLYYPSGEPIEVYDIYTHVCPCDTGLTCTDNFCAQDESYENNYLY